MRDWANPFSCALLACASLLAMPATALAEDLHLQPGIFSDPSFDPTVSVGTSISHASGTAHEFVYTNAGSYKLSELDWQIKDVLMLNASLGIRLTPWVAFQLSGGTKLSGNSQLDDYDWLQKGKDWSHWSDHPDTNVTDANRIDASGNLTLFRHPNFNLDAVAGLRWNEWAFSAKAGHYIYSSKTGFRDQIGDFASGLVVGSYKQNLITPYLGLAFSANYDRFSFDASVLGSAWSYANTYDQHYVRGLLFHDTTHNANYYDYKFGFDYQYSERVNINVGWEREVYQLVKGGETISTLGSGVNGSGGKTGAWVLGQGTGNDNSTDRYSVGLTYSLY